MNPECYLSPEASGHTSMRRIPWRNATGKHIPVRRTLTSLNPGEVHVVLYGDPDSDSVNLTIPTGRGFLVGIR